MSILSNLERPRGSKHRKKRLGCGRGSGHGKTSTRGAKGAKSRSGTETSPGFEGGQMPFKRRIPKRGFKNINRKEYAIIKLHQIKNLQFMDVIDEPFLISHFKISTKFDGIKLLSDGEIDKAVRISVTRASKAAIIKVEQVGGKVEIISAKSP